MDINNVGKHTGACGGETLKEGRETTNSVAQNMIITGIS